jgi:hypothetical protein
MSQILIAGIALFAFAAFCGVQLVRWAMREDTKLDVHSDKDDVEKRARRAF